jgi:hypothetical protein
LAARVAALKASIPVWPVTYWSMASGTAARST